MRMCRLGIVSFLSLSKIVESLASLTLVCPKLQWRSHHFARATRFSLLLSSALHRLHCVLFSVFCFYICVFSSQPLTSNSVWPFYSSLNIHARLPLWYTDQECDVLREYQQSKQDQLSSNTVQQKAKTMATNNVSVAVRWVLFWSCLC